LAYWRFYAPDGSIRGNNEDLTTMIFAKRNGKMVITACENVESSAQAQAFDPVTLRQKSKK
jgi:TATA-box binding protein (TBP) (component of TFIID and TFIIIB)